jgi:hypothetical protein
VRDVDRCATAGHGRAHPPVGGAHGRNQPGDEPARQREHPLGRVAAGVREQQPRGLVRERRQQPGRQLGVRRVDSVAERRRQLGHHGGAAAGDGLVQPGRRALVAHEHEPPCRGILPDGLQVAAERGDEPLLRVRARERGGKHTGELAQRAGALARHERVEQAGEVVEVPVDDRAADPCLAGDPLDRDGVEAARGHDRLRDVEQLLPPGFGRHAGGHACGHPHAHVTQP